MENAPNPAAPNFAGLAAHLADPARAGMMLALMDGRALTVSELGAGVGLGKASASAHLTRLEQAGLLVAERQGRHKYLRLASAQVAGLIEAMMALAASQGGPATRPAPRTGPRDPALREARVCYNHLAGRLGVAMYESLSGRGFLAHAAGGLHLTAPGRDFALGLGITAADLAEARTPLCRDCLDWSERRHHLAGHLGRLLLTRVEAAGWLRRMPGSRALQVTPKGRAEFFRTFPAVSPAGGTADDPAKDGKTGCESLDVAPDCP